MIDRARVTKLKQEDNADENWAFCTTDLNCVGRISERAVFLEQDQILFHYCTQKGQIISLSLQTGLF